MKQVFTRKCKTFQIIVIIFVMLALICVAAMTLLLGYKTGSNAYFEGSILVVILLVVSMAYPIIYAILEINNTITIDSIGISVEKPFKVISFTWEDIVEFRAHYKGIGEWARWRYYFISSSHGNKPIEIADYNIKKLDDLIDAIFLMATNAKFVLIDNISPIPFLRKTKVYQWDRSGRSA